MSDKTYSFDATLCVMSGSNSEDEAADKILEHCDGVGTVEKGRGAE